ncbi:hypothetical protein Q0Z83_027670 [Actinoplanes sichuanensis]|uniref:Tetratricopeptide repeat protein n=1 Tax=Actinoplanes sichuanensis TaxID=512349 RepID=A0ABW4AU34_9ACTN|nr:hypothetical protein [Actinoplanes sichuanensis]BEL04576.1 hypothetical protein Q0Z83_027670 [Actinoplanes sichuanensis]
MPPESVDASWLEAARQQLAWGDGVRAAYLALVRDGAGPEAAATAVCVAAGSTAAEAIDRLREFEGLWDALEPGDEDIGADLLMMYGYFEPDATLDDRQQAALVHLHAALGSVPGLPSGSALALSIRLRTGRLAEAHRLLERLGGVRWPDDIAFWAALRRAGEILHPGNEIPKNG